nr:type VI immunity family protein [Acinetobacter sp. Marseille-Q1620]
MNDEELFITLDEVLDYIGEFKKDSDHIYGYEQEEFGISPYITFYIYRKVDEVENIANKVIDIYEEFENEIIDKPFKKRYRDTGTWKNASKWKPSREELIDEMHQSYKKYFVYFIAATTGVSAIQSARWVFQSSIQELNNRYTIVKMNFGEKWYRSNKQHWYGFIQKCLIKLNPIQAYSGYEIGSATAFNIVPPEFETVERIFSDYFYGLDIDHPNMSHSHDDPDGFIYTPALAAGLRTPTWCFLLSPYWLEKLGLSEEQIRAKLNDPRIEISKIEDEKNQGQYSLWIRLGELSLYPVEEGVPDLLVMANELIKPIRCNELKLTTLDAWDDDPNPRFDMENSPKWIARFDHDSDWPEGKRVNQVYQVQSEEILQLKATAGEICPRTGEWYSLANQMEKRHFDQGEVMPEIKNNPWGETIWYFSER